jgi:deoxyhypusine synthase
MAGRQLSDGAEDGLLPLKTLDLANIGSFDELLRAMSLTAFGGRSLGEAGEVLEAMVTDPECTVVLTLSGAMTVAKMGLVITEMIERGWVQAVVSTGALMTHGLVELAGMEHYKAAGDVDDAELFERGYNRVYDTYEMEKNLNELAARLRGVFDLMPEGQRFSSHELCGKIGEYLDAPGVRGVMASAWRKKVPIYIPAFTDSELGLDIATYVIGRALAEGRGPVEDILDNLNSPYDPFRDLGHYASLIRQSPRIGIFTIGGGVPRNWAQQVAPFLDITNLRCNTQLPERRFHYGVRICPEPVHWGGLSGCTYSEGVSWGKFVPPAEGGRFAEVYADATIAWPIVVKGVMERLERSGKAAACPPVRLR